MEIVIKIHVFIIVSLTFMCSQPAEALYAAVIFVTTHRARLSTEITVNHY